MTVRYQELSDNRVAVDRASLEPGERFGLEIRIVQAGPVEWVTAEIEVEVTREGYLKVRQDLGIRRLNGVSWNDDLVLTGDLIVGQPVQYAARSNLEAPLRTYTSLKLLRLLRLQCQLVPVEFPGQ